LLVYTVCILTNKGICSNKTVLLNPILIFSLKNPIHFYHAFTPKKGMYQYLHFLRPVNPQKGNAIDGIFLRPQHR
ncbi:hypothetical protein ACUNGK_25690, partial [Serratia sp. IR-2025]